MSLPTFHDLIQAGLLNDNDGKIPEAANESKIKKSDLVAPLAWALGITLYLGYDSDGERRVFIREGKRLFKAVNGMKLDAHMGLKAQYIGERCAGILVKIRKHLFVYVSYWHSENQTVIQFVNWREVDAPTDEDIKRRFDKVHPRGSMLALIPATVAAYKKPATSTEWSALDLNTLDQRHEQGVIKPGTPTNQW